VKRLLLNCDQVFEVLTRGPFPSGGPQDEAVERHLRACHECRQLAEALRPAVALLHEAVSSEEADQLPEYQGSLPWQRRTGRRKTSVVRLAGPQKSKTPPPLRRVPTVSRGEPRQPQLVSAIRLIAASLILAALGLIFGNNIFAPTSSHPAGTQQANMPQATTDPIAVVKPLGPSQNLTSGVPTAQGLLTLASLKLPNTCLPFSHRPISPVEAAQIASAISDGSLNGLRCCTECHRSGSHRSSAPHLVASVQQSCQACHRS